MTFVLGNVLQPLIDVFESVLKFFHDSVGLGWGLSIIALTVCVRTLLVPLTVKQLKSTRAIQRIAPEMKAVSEKYKDDPQRKQQETMALYKEHKVNPFGSCLPLLAQMPVFISLFYMLRRDLREDICGQTAKACGDIGHAERFLFVPDITGKATGLVLITLLVLYVGSQLVSSLLIQATPDRNQRLLLLGMPVLFVPFIIGFPAGLMVYWITTNLWTIGQGALVRRTSPPIVRPGEPPPESMLTALLKKRESPEPSGSDGDSTPKKPKGSSGGNGSGAAPKRDAPPPRPPRQKKKRSGRRR